MLNCITIQGRLVRNIEFKTTTNGASVANFCIANDISFPKTTNFINCVAWRKTAEFVEKWFHKGDLILITGSLTIREWTGKDGNKRHEPEIQVREIDFCGKSEGGSSLDVFQSIDDSDEELPF